MSACEMLLQSHDGVIRVWPAAPKNWDGVFSLRAQTGFMVSSERSGGNVNFIDIESLFGDECRIVVPWHGKTEVSSEGRKIEQSGEGGVVAFKTDKGKKYLVTPEKKAAAVFHKIEPAENNDVKGIGPSQKGGKMEVRPPMLGITSDGLTYPRLLLKNTRGKLDALIADATKGKHKIKPSAASCAGHDGKLTPLAMAVRWSVRRRQHRRHARRL